MTKWILGIHAGHNSGACIGNQSGMLYAIQEERLNREKNYWGFPKSAIEACLRQAGATIADIDSIAYGGNQVFCRYHSRDDLLYAYQRYGTFLGRIRQRFAMPLITALRPKYGQDKLRQHLATVGLADTKVVHFEHHYSHAATAYYGLRSSPEKKYLVVTCDGAGDDYCATARLMGGGEDRLIAATPWGESLGAVYSWVTYGMGFVPMEHEYKLMGMAPYASENAAIQLARVFHKYLRLSDDGLRFQRKTRHRMNDVYATLETDLRGKRFDHICAGLQRFTEDLLCDWVQALARHTGVRDVLAAGGVFMNVKANKRIGELADVDSFEAFPSCGDETLPIGAFYLEAASRFGDHAVKPLQTFYLGDDLDDTETLTALRQSGIPFECPSNMADRIATLLAAGHPVARCAGPMEFGARALGNRSILADPRNHDVVRVINQMVKKRDFWMPFAPMVKHDRQERYLINPKSLRSPYMMMTFDTRENFRELIAAVHNADLTCRAQIIEPHQNRDMYEILSAFENKTGLGVLLNTSFNLHGFPIVRTGAEAIDVLQNSGLQYLQVGKYLAMKSSPTA